MSNAPTQLKEQSKTYGYFDDERDEYVITHPKTPRPWQNFLYNERYCRITSQTGAGYSFWRDCRVRRITRWDGKRIMYNRPGHYLFLRDADRKEYWSATGDPWQSIGDEYLCRHGLGYTTISNKSRGIASEITYFVPREDDLEIWRVKVTNQSILPRQLQAFTYVEFVLGDRDMDVVLPSIDCLYKTANWDDHIGGILAQAFANKPLDQSFNAFLGTSATVHGYDTRAATFAGGYYDNLEHPHVMETGQCTGSKVHGEDMVGVLQHNFTLQPGESCMFSVVLGPCWNLEKARSMIQKYSDLANVEAELQQVNQFWQLVVNRIEIETPDENFNRFANVWLKYQLYTSNYWSRSASFYHEGEGGRGYRDSSQDAEGIVALDAQYTRDKIRKLCFYQHNTGQPAAGWSEVRGVYHEKPFKDHPLWLPFTIASYVRETGDVTFLHEVVKFHDGEEASIYEHGKRALNFLYQDRGSRGLPHFGQYNHADWNDAFDALTGDAESVWTAMGLCRSMKTMMELAEIMGDTAYLPDLHKRYDELKELVNTIGWDGEWYLRGFDNKGQLVGSRSCEEGQLFLNTQSWAVLSEVASPDRAQQVLRKVDEMLDSDIGPALFAPVYTKYNPELGRITLFAPGTKENAAVFCHAAVFKIVADCMAGRGEQAVDTFNKLCPTRYSQDQYKAEPYVLAEYLIGPSSPDRAGEGAYTWQTGTAAWMFIAVAQWILGARATFKGLLVDPCLPAAWKHCAIKRPFRDALYEIEIENPNGVTHGVKEVLLDGKPIAGQLLPLPESGMTYQVKVTMG
jgi:cellobiose phosphorylase